MKRALLALAFWLLAGAAQAQQYVESGDYRVYYAAINSSQLAPEIARRYGITAARDVALLTFNAQRRDGERWLPVAAGGEARVRSLIGHQRKLPLRSVREQELQTLATSLDFDDGEFLLIEADILPSGANAPLRLNFKQQFYRD